LKSFRFILLFLSFGLASSLQARYLYLLEGFEREINWEVESDSAAVGRVVDDQHFTEGGHGLKLLVNASSASARGVYKRRGSLDLSPYRALLLDVYNPAPLANARVSVLFRTDEDGSYEAFSPPLKPGWNKDVRLDFDKPVFASGETGWKPEGFLKDRNQIKQLRLNVYPGETGQMSVTVDNLRLERGGLVSVGSLSLDTTLDATVSGAHLDYVPPDMRLRPQDLNTFQGFEGADPGWTPTFYDTDGNPVPGPTPAVSSDYASQGGHSYAQSFPASPGGFDLALLGVESSLAGTGQFRLDVYNPGPSVWVQLKVKSGGITYKSKPLTELTHGWNTPIYDFTNQLAWDGGALTPVVLAGVGPGGVVLNVISNNPGRLYFDDLSTSSIALRGAARTGALVSLSYNPRPDFELLADARVEDTFYGQNFGPGGDARDSGVQTYLNSVKTRWDAGEFRTNLLYRQKITQSDQPIVQLVSPEKLGLEIAALEFGGRQEGTEVQGLAATRLEYGHYNDRVPTGFGPENLTFLRVRQDLGEGFRLGGTALNHQTSYGTGTYGIPISRQTFGLDLDSQFDLPIGSLSCAMEGGGTFGDRYQFESGVPTNDNFYYAASLSPSLGRLGLSAYYALLGYDFDADFTKDGGNSVYEYYGFGYNLESWGPFCLLDHCRLYDGSLCHNLRLTGGFSYKSSRDQYLDTQTGLATPRNQNWFGELALTNDDTCQPHLELKLDPSDYEDQWSHFQSWVESADLDLPVGGGIQARLGGEWEQDRFGDKPPVGDTQSGEDWSQKVDLTLDRTFHGSLTLAVGGLSVLSRTNWEGAWADPESHFKFTASISKSLGPNSLVRLDYGQAALHGRDFGIQDTIDVWTLTAKTYF
jgi:hypothetical protein